MTLVRKGVYNRARPVFSRIFKSPNYSSPMSSSTAQKEDLISIGQGIYLRNGIAPSSLKSSVSPPTVILIFAWMGSRLAHVRRYVNSYDEIYPEATKLVIQSEPSFFWSSERAKKAYLAPAVEVLQRLDCLSIANNTSKLVRSVDAEPTTPNPTPRVLIHVFSNGGSFQLSTLSQILAPHSTRYTVSEALATPSAVILDSCPGDGGFEPTLRAFERVVQNRFLRRLIPLFLRFIYMWVSISKLILPRRASIFDTMKATLNTPNLLPWLRKDTPRLYIYSKADDIIPYSDVEAHAAAGISMGLPIRLERFNDSPHVAHARMYPQRYWDAVQKLWEEASIRK